MTFSRLTLGDPRLKSKLRGGSVETVDPCSEPDTLGTSVLDDPGVENQLSEWGGGPGGDEVPVFQDYNGNFLSELVWGDNSTGPSDSYWVQGESQAPSSEFPWTIVTTDPHSGTYHLKTTSMRGGGYTAITTWPVNFEKCDHVVSDFLDPYWITSKIAEGEVIDLSLWAKMAGAGSDVAFVSATLQFLDANGHYTGNNESILGSANATLTNTYAQYTTSFIAPSGQAYFMLAISIGALTSGTAGTQRDVYLDDITLGRME